MSPNENKDAFYLGNMLDAMDAIEEHLKLGFSEMVVKKAIVFELMTIGEAVTKLSAGVKKKHDDIAWNLIAGTRHRIVHEYFHIDYDLIEKIVYGQLPLLRGRIEEILKEYSHG